MDILNTKRLILRPLAPEDASAVAEAVNEKGFMRFMYHWRDESAASAERFLSYAVRANEQTPQTDYQYACICREDKALCACLSLNVRGDEGMLGWFAHHDMQGMGYVTEGAQALMDYAFDTLGLRRLTAACDTRNERSIALMKRLSMRYEGCFSQARPLRAGDARPGDEAYYAILQSEWADFKDYERLAALPVTFDGFMDIPELTDGEIRLVCLQKHPASAEKKHVPMYQFGIVRGGQLIGDIALRIGYAMPRLYYGGQIGYNIAENYRGHGYAGRACHLLIPIMRYHGMGLALITNDEDNASSRRVCEKLGARRLRLSRLPEWHDMYERGIRYVNIYEWRFGAEGKA